MAKLYFNKIYNGEINAKTGKPWAVEDVPAKWRSAVEKMLENE